MNVSATTTTTASPTTRVEIEVASVTDRGLSQKRPVNEDSFLAAIEHSIFAVADGVGGAESGEVASQRAIEILDEAFRQQGNGDDIEDLMELALQRANKAIYQMSREPRRLTMMATTIVALHLDCSGAETRATIGHVGDSRVYRFTPEGRLMRETVDHSVVEEEVRAGRMTPDQAAHHPSRNVINRALGAADDVEVDMHTLAVEEGTTFLLCSDGITRHVDDAELEQLVASEPDLNRVCAILRERCFERGAEDNLTAVLVRVGAHSASSNPVAADVDAERTLASADSTDVGLHNRAHASTQTSPPTIANLDSRPARSSAAEDAALVVSLPSAEPFIQPHRHPAASRIEVSAVDVLPSNVVVPGAQADARGNADATRKILFGGAIAFFLLIAAAIVFFGGVTFERYNRADTGTPGTLTNAPEATVENGSQVNPQPSAPPASGSSSTPELKLSYVEQRQAIDAAPALMAQKMLQEHNGAPLQHTDPEFLYLYGRALLRIGKTDEASEAFRRAVTELKTQAAKRPETGDATKLRAAETELHARTASATENASKLIDEMMEAMHGTKLSSHPVPDVAAKSLSG